MPDAIASGPNGHLWFTEQGANGGKIGEMTTAGIQVSDTQAASSTGAGIAGITVGPDGNLWFTEWSANKIGRITPGGTISEFPTREEEGDPEDITVGKNGDIWFTEGYPNMIVRIEPRLLNAKCLVPKLKGRTLAQARQALRRAHCNLGRVSRPAGHNKRRLVVVRQTPAARRSLPFGGKVNVRLG
jgi:streptogramin lyase